jgi:hypothetical protein
MDGTENKRGTIKNYVKLKLEINGRKTTTHLFVTRLGKERIILGFPWLNEQNPDINQISIGGQKNLPGENKNKKDLLQ